MDNNTNNGVQQEERFYTDYGVGSQEGNFVSVTPLYDSASGNGQYCYLKLAVKSGFTHDENGKKVQKTEFWSFMCNDNVARAAQTLQKGQGKIEIEYHLSVSNGKATGQNDSNGNPIYEKDSFVLRAFKIRNCITAPKENQGNATQVPQGNVQQFAPQGNVQQFAAPGAAQMPVANMQMQQGAVMGAAQMPQTAQMPTTAAAPAANMQIQQPATPGAVQPQATAQMPAPAATTWTPPQAAPGAAQMPTTAAAPVQNVQQFTPAQAPQFAANFSGALPFNA